MSGYKRRAFMKANIKSEKVLVLCLYDTDRARKACRGRDRKTKTVL